LKWDICKSGFTSDQYIDGKSLYKRRKELRYLQGEGATDRRESTEEGKMAFESFYGGPKEIELRKEFPLSTYHSISIGKLLSCEVFPIQKWVMIFPEKSGESKVKLD